MSSLIIFTILAMNLVQCASCAMRVYHARRMHVEFMSVHHFSAPTAGIVHLDESHRISILLGGRLFLIGVQPRSLGCA